MDDLSALTEGYQQYFFAERERERETRPIVVVDSISTDEMEACLQWSSAAMSRMLGDIAHHSIWSVLHAASSTKQWHFSFLL